MSAVLLVLLVSFGQAQQTWSKPHDGVRDDQGYLVRRGGTRADSDWSWKSVNLPVNWGVGCQGCCWDPVHDRIYQYCGQFLGGAYDFSRDCQCFDPKTGTWTQLSSAGKRRGWFEGAYCRDRVYAIAGCDENYNLIRRCEAFDIARDTWSTIESIPRAEEDCQAAVYRDSLIYVIGGRTMDTITGWYTDSAVQIYDVYSGAWASGTPMMAPCMMSDCAIIGDTIWFMGGYQWSSRRLDTCIRIGAINPANPTQITWSYGPALPPRWSHGHGRYGGPTVALNGKLYAFGGWNDTSGHLRPDSACYVFDPATRTFDSLPPYPTKACRFGGVTRQKGLELYGLGGDVGDWVFSPGTGSSASETLRRTVSSRRRMWFSPATP